MPGLADVNATLATLIEEGVCTAKQLALWSGCCDRSVYLWLSGEREPRATQVNLVGQKLPEPARLRLAAAVLRGWGLSVEPGDPVKAADMMGTAIRTEKEAAELAEVVHEAQLPDSPGGRSVTPEEQRRIDCQASGVIDEAARTMVGKGQRTWRIG